MLPLLNRALTVLGALDKKYLDRGFPNGQAADVKVCRR